jgi:hypothetical protein
MPVIKDLTAEIQRPCRKHAIILPTAHKTTIKQLC